MIVVVRSHDVTIMSHASNRLYDMVHKKYNK